MQNKPIVIIQARMGSTRLPGKVLLPVAGLPSVILCARRAANSGFKTVVAIPGATTDDVLADTLKGARVPYFRGSLNDVLGRMAGAARKAGPGNIIVRLTADNLLPDGLFIKELVAYLIASGKDYTGTSSPEDGLPYGLSAEAFYAAALFRADRIAKEPHEREHVTPWIRSHLKTTLFRPNRIHGDISQYRCTIDNIQDYEEIVRLFKDIRDPVKVPWHVLVKKLIKVQQRWPVRIPWQKGRNGALNSTMTLGCAQLGMNYGRANKTGRPAPNEASEILRTAANHGIYFFDTARAYGASEEVLGASLTPLRLPYVRVITKLAPHDNCIIARTPEGARLFTENSVTASLLALKVDRLDTLLLHRHSFLRLAKGEGWKRLVEYQQQGIIQTLGVSVQTPAELLSALKVAEVGHVQLPFNLLDWRWREQAVQKAIKRRPDVGIHVRSVFLQGLLLSTSSDWPKFPGVDVKGILSALDGLVKRFKRQNRADLCIAYVRAQSWVTSLVLGVETLEQLGKNMRLFSASSLLPAQCRIVDSYFKKSAPPQLLDPSRWPLTD